MYVFSPSVETTDIVAREGLRVRPLIVLDVDKLSDKLDPALLDASETATHCRVTSSVNSRVPF